MSFFDTGRIFALFLAVLVPIALAGCGGSSADTHASEHGASHDHGDHGHDHGDHGHDHDDHAKQADHAEHGDHGDHDHGDHGHGHDAAKPKSGTDAVGAVKAFDQAPQAGAKAICPACGEVVEVTADTPQSEHGGKHYAHCCAGCKTKFDADPASFVAPAAEG